MSVKKKVCATGEAGTGRFWPSLRRDVRSTTYSLVHESELLELLAQSGLLGVPSEAAVACQ